MGKLNRSWVDWEWIALSQGKRVVKDWRVGWIRWRDGRANGDISRNLWSVMCVNQIVDVLVYEYMTIDLDFMF